MAFVSTDEDAFTRQDVEIKSEWKVELAAELYQVLAGRVRPLLWPHVGPRKGRHVLCQGLMGDLPGLESVKGIYYNYFPNLIIVISQELVIKAQDSSLHHASQLKTKDLN